MDIALAKASKQRRMVLEDDACKMQLEMLVAERSRALNEALENLNDLQGAGCETLAIALDLHDQGTSGHSRRVADMTLEIAKNLGIAASDLRQMECGVLLHDIGKLRIPDSILWKPAKLDPEEWEIMRRHPEYGYDFVKK